MRETKYFRLNPWSLAVAGGTLNWIVMFVLITIEFIGQRIDLGTYGQCFLFAISTAVFLFSFANLYNYFTFKFPKTFKSFIDRAFKSFPEQ